MRDQIRAIIHCERYVGEITSDYNTLYQRVWFNLAICNVALERKQSIGKRHERQRLGHITQHPLHADQMKAVISKIIDLFQGNDTNSTAEQEKSKIFSLSYLIPCIRFCTY